MQQSGQGQSAPRGGSPGNGLPDGMPIADTTVEQRAEAERFWSATLSPRLLMMAWRLLGRRRFDLMEGPEEAVQEFAPEFLRMWKNYDPKLSTVSWFKRSFERWLQKRQNNNGHTAPLELTEEVENQAASAKLAPQEERLMMKDLVASVLRSLSAHDRSVLEMRYLEELPWAKIAGKLGIEMEAARQKGSRIIKDLRRRLRAEQDSDEGDTNE